MASSLGQSSCRITPCTNWGLPPSVKEVKIHPTVPFSLALKIFISATTRGSTPIRSSRPPLPVRIGAYVHIGAGCYLAGGGGIIMDDLSTLSQGVKIYSINDDYSGASLTNSTVPSIYKLVKEAPVHLGRHVIVGAGSVVLPGANIAEGSAVGALSLVSQATAPWGIYGGSAHPQIKRTKPRSFVYRKTISSGLCGSLVLGE